MSNHFYNDSLYPLQDRVLKEIGASGTSFYLTGGTVLGRFLLHHRYSDDLDFFLNSASDFGMQISKLIDYIALTFQDIRLNNQQDSFARFYVVEGELKLKIEFVNDVKYRVGTPARNELGLQLMNFDLGKLGEVKFLEGFDKNKITKEYFEILAKESLHGFDNSLYGRTLH
jgi:Nucleotidyl transferase AbiEii toxin, Type IV TA system